MTISAQVGVGISSANIDPSAQLEVSSTTKGFLSPRMTEIQRNNINNPADGLLVYQTDGTKGFYYFDGSVWKQSLGLLQNGTINQVLATDGLGNTNWTDVPESVDLTSDQTVGGLKTFASSDGLLATGMFGEGITSSLYGGTRMMWYPKKAAFRAGKVDGTEWNDSNIGNYSTAMGSSTTASAEYSTALGYGSKASGNFSTALGYLTTASDNGSTAFGQGTLAYAGASTAFGDYSRALASNSTAMGKLTTASGNASTVMGVNTSTRSFAETTIGTHNTDYIPSSTSEFIATDRLFVIGNGTDTATSDALVMLKNGDTTFSGQIKMGAVTYPNTVGLANQVLTTDGVGNAIWSAPSTASSVDNDPLPIVNGGTGSAIQNFVDLSNNQTVGGDKTFSSNLSSNGNITSISFIKSGGTATQYLMADGSTSTAAEINEADDEFLAIISQTSFTLTQTPKITSKVKMYINGVKISKSAYGVSGSIVIYYPANNGSYTISLNDRIQFEYTY